MDYIVVVISLIVLIGRTACKEISLQYEVDNISKIENEESLKPHTRTRRCEYPIKKKWKDLKMKY